MNAKRHQLIPWAVRSALLGVVCAATGQILSSDHQPPGLGSRAASGLHATVGVTDLTAADYRFDPSADVLLRHYGEGRQSELFDLETGRQLREPTFESFGNNALANIAWIKTNGLDISGLVFDRTNVSCITYYLAAVPVERRLWADATPAQVATHPALAQIHDPKRTALSPERDGTDTFLFRTQEGTAGILQIRGVGPDSRSVKLRYKLARPDAVGPAAVSFAGRAGPGK